MLNKAVKFMGWLLAFMISIDAWLFVSLKILPALYVLYASILLLFIIFSFFSIRAYKLEMHNAGLSHVLEKSEEKRINAEELKNKILVIIDDLPEGILIVDKDDKISAINKRAEKFLDVNRKQVLGKSVLDLSHLSRVKNIIIPLMFNLNGGNNEADNELSGKKIEIEKNLILNLNIEPVFLDKNNKGKLIILNDVTKIYHAEEAKKQFVSLVSHQLKSPLSAVGLSLKMMISKEFGKISKEQRNILEKAYKKNEALIYLVNDLLNDAKVNGNNNISNKSLVNFEDLVNSVVDFYKDEIKKKKIIFKFIKSENKLPGILCEVEKIKMVVHNLVDNAIKYTPSKGSIQISILPQKEEIEFRIKDSGIGIPEDQEDKIFKRFSRASNAVAVQADGSGLGLAIAKDIIKRHHGRIWFQSEVNKGSTFFFSLPFVRR